MAGSVSNPLTLIMTIKSPQDCRDLQALIGGFQQLSSDQNPIVQALTRIGTVHFARFVFLSPTELAIITTFDDSFETYIDAFVNSIGKVFDQLLMHVKDAPPLPVSDNRKAFLDYVKKNDRASASFYCAYPDLKVMDILTMQKLLAKK